MIVARHQLQPPQNADDWQSYHSIRRQVLFERRGETYDDQHPDEHLPAHHALLLKHDGTGIGVIRVDIEGTTATFRRVAIQEGQQRSGHGRALISLAESFARNNGCNLIYSFVAPDAVGFYEKCGFVFDLSQPGDPHHVPMHKKLL
jgi:GNAT superfamily N-acetyltransferase